MTGAGITGTATFEYDGNKKRVQHTVNGTTTEFFYSRSGALLDKKVIAPNTQTTAYLRFAGQTIGKFTGSVANVTYYHNDHLGSPMAASDAAGNVLWRERYTPYGEKLDDPAAQRDDIGFTGHVQDDATGLTYMQ